MEILNSDIKKMGYARKVGQDFRIFRIYKINILKTK